ncbi:hypothetical protein [Curtobacterium sp. MCBA15_001]|uniref:hypothetical protein n=1 Tax=Curtobacterium sp. MCBA15_001 TaxID=1898731 RepID=UPI0008DD44C6|nr:hypothetical protein [Curtobacterium sp. MCBA15_001]OIH95106.1 hypothetical protein BIU90_02915 [Curtobacterium sp. MCBA15_001]
MTSKALDTAEKCVQRADAFVLTGQSLHDVGDEWAVVCYFYASYHLMRAAFIGDTIFDSVARLSAVDSRFTLADRFVAMHRGRKGDRERKPGVNDIVSKLYPQISFEYLELHQWSVNVRYNEGLEPSASIADAKLYYERIRSAFDAGTLKAK